MDDFEFLFDIRVEKTIEVKSVRSLLPAREVGYLVSVDDVAFCAELIDVADLGVYGSQ